MADALRLGFAVVLVVFGLSALAGWLTAFRNRLYLACVGVALFALGGGLAIGGEVSGALRGLQVALWVTAALAFLVGAWLAIADVKRELEAIQQQRQGLEREMHEYMKRLEAEHDQPPAEDEGGSGKPPDQQNTS